MRDAQSPRGPLTMAKESTKAQPPEKGWFTTTVDKFFRRIPGGGTPADDIDDGEWAFADQMSTRVLSGGSEGQSRTRQTIYDDWQTMLSDPVVAGAIKINITAALGGNENTGELVFVEPKAQFANDKAAVALVDEIRRELCPLFNRAIVPLAFNAVGYGDGYARILSRPKEGVLSLVVDELMHPGLIQPYEQGEETRVCVVMLGHKMREKLTPDQIVRVKMPRTQYVAQPLAIHKAMRARILEDDPDKHVLMPSLAGGSFLIDAERQYQNFAAALNGLVGQRVLDSIDETIFAAQVQGLTKEQRQEFIGGMKRILTTSKAVAAAQVKAKAPLLERIRHILPVFSDKQIVQVQALGGPAGSGAGRAGSTSIEDVMFHAKLLAGSLGVDLTLLGFADQMSGGLGEGGFFRTSVQAAERSRIIRVAIEDAFNHIVRVHLLLKHGRLYKDADAPWDIQFYGSISAMETERQRTAADAMNAGALFVQAMTQLRDAGLDAKTMTHILSKIFKIDEDAAAMYAKALEKAKPAEDDGGGGGFSGGGFGRPGGNPQTAPGGTGDNQDGDQEDDA